MYLNELYTIINDEKTSYKIHMRINYKYNKRTPHGHFLTFLFLMPHPAAQTIHAGFGRSIIPSAI